MRSVLVCDFSAVLLLRLLLFVSLTLAASLRRRGVTELHKVDLPICVRGMASKMTIFVGREKRGRLSLQ